MNPKVIVLLAGINNVGIDPGEPEKVLAITARLRRIVDVCREKATNATIILTAIFPRADHPEVSPAINQINRNLAAFADGRKLRYLDINNQLTDRSGNLLPGMLNPDQLHPTLKTYQIWAEALKPIFTELLGPPAHTDLAPPPTGDPSVTH